MAAFHVGVAGEFTRRISKSHSISRVPIDSSLEPGLFVDLWTYWMFFFVMSFGVSVVKNHYASDPAKHAASFRGFFMVYLPSVFAGYWQTGLVLLIAFAVAAWMVLSELLHSEHRGGGSSFWLIRLVSFAFTFIVGGVILGVPVFGLRDASAKMMVIGGCLLALCLFARYERYTSDSEYSPIYYYLAFLLIGFFSGLCLLSSSTARSILGLPEWLVSLLCLTVVVCSVRMLFLQYRRGRLKLRSWLCLMILLTVLILTAEYMENRWFPLFADHMWSDVVYSISCTSVFALMVMRHTTSVMQASGFQRGTAQTAKNRDYSNSEMMVVLLLLCFLPLMTFADQGLVEVTVLYIFLGAYFLRHVFRDALSKFLTAESTRGASSQTSSSSSERFAQSSPTLRSTSCQSAPRSARYGRFWLYGWSLLLLLFLVADRFLYRDDIDYYSPFYPLFPYLAAGSFIIIVIAVVSIRRRIGMRNLLARTDLAMRCELIVLCVNLVLFWSGSAVVFVSAWEQNIQATALQQPDDVLFRADLVSSDYLSSLFSHNNDIVGLHALSWALLFLLLNCMLFSYTMVVRYMHMFPAHIVQKEHEYEESYDQTPAVTTQMSCDEVASTLRKLRQSHNEISYAEIARRIKKNRIAQGIPASSAATAVSSIYDCFRPGRKRINRELVSEIIQAIETESGNEQ